MTDALYCICGEERTAEEFWAMLEEEISEFADAHFDDVADAQDPSAGIRPSAALREKGEEARRKAVSALAKAEFEAAKERLDESGEYRGPVGEYEIR